MSDSGFGAEVGDGDAALQRIVAIETSGRGGSAAVGNCDCLLGAAEFAADRDHARALIPTVRELCDGQGWRPQTLTACFLSIGPGSFTGLRVGVTFARHLALAAGLEIVAVPTLDVIAAGCDAMPSPPPHLAVILDAKRGQVFGGLYERRDGRYRPVADPMLLTVAELLARSSELPAVTGEGISFHRRAVDAAGAAIVSEAFWKPTAAHVLALGRERALKGQFTPPADLIPLYIRRPEAEELWEKRRAGKDGRDIAAK